MSVVYSLESWQLEPISFEPKLDYDNFSLWSYKIEVVLKSRGLWHLVDGNEVAPPEGSTVRERWEMRDACARLQFLVNIRDRWVWIFKQATTAQEIWSALQEHFLPESQFKQSLSMRRFTSARLAEGGDTKAHVQRMGELWQDVLASRAYTSKDKDAFFVTTLLDSLPPSWEVFVSAWKVMPDPSRVSCATVIGHILDLDAWNRGRADAHGGHLPGNGGAHKRRVNDKLIDS
jgi:gag-polypeptide of LTR copia-type